MDIDTHKQLFDEIHILGLIRNNLSHGKLNNTDHWNSLVTYVATNPSLDMIEDVVYINETGFLMQALDTISSLKSVLLIVSSRVTQTWQ